jgi:hypothetical protein
MSKQYDPMIHTHAIIKHPTAKRGEGWDGCFGIVLHTGERVWVGASHAHERTPEILQVSDGTSNGYDVHGNCVLSVPAAWCQFYPPEEADGIEQCIDADGCFRTYETLPPLLTWAGAAFRLTDKHQTSKK